MWFEIFEDTGSNNSEPWRWRLRTDSGVIAASTIGYVGKAECRTAIRDLAKISPQIPVEVRTSAPQGPISLPVARR